MKNLCYLLAGAFIGVIVMTICFQPSTNIMKSDILGAGENEHGNYVISIDTSRNPDYYTRLAENSAKKEIERVKNL